MTRKHLKFQSNEIVESPKNITCDICLESFGSRSTLWRHKQKCNTNKSQLTNVDNKIDTNTKLMLEIIKQNNELKELIINLCKKLE